ncbi:unnamed protein product [Haemonchus placei]|uniref:Peptidase S1 domain-containing protein n=1 Tax=Haemonchus placei TaxID=6290 RepID=A0A0N4WWC2_HAEPC|nr:unnamed protein product [Haemonchus placei]
MLLKLLITALLPAIAFGVLHGIPSSPYETRSLVSVISRFPNLPDGQAMICGGVIITQNTVLTAAHCVNDGSVSPCPQMKIGFQTARGNEDMALLYLPKPIECKPYQGPQVARLPPMPGNNTSPFFDPIKSPITDIELESAVCVASGWGLTRPPCEHHAFYNRILLDPAGKQ